MPRKRILVVEDNPMNMELVCEVLEAHGYEVWQATSAAEALERLKRVKPDLILMDVQLPGLDGLALTKRLKQEPATRDRQALEALEVMTLPLTALSVGLGAAMMPVFAMMFVILVPVRWMFGEPARR